MFLVNVEKCRKLFDHVYVSSENDTILAQAEAAGAIPIKRPKALCGNVPNIPVYRHAVRSIPGAKGIVAVQANSPTISERTIADVKKLMEWGFDEIITVHPDGSIYGSVWAMTMARLAEYKDFYHPITKDFITDPSIDIHTQEDYEQALCQSTSQ